MAQPQHEHDTSLLGLSEAWEATTKTQEYQDNLKYLGNKEMIPVLLYRVFKRGFQAGRGK